MSADVGQRWDEMSPPLYEVIEDSPGEQCFCGGDMYEDDERPGFWWCECCGDCHDLRSPRQKAEQLDDE